MLCLNECVQDSDSDVFRFKTTGGNMLLMEMAAEEVIIRKYPEDQSFRTQLGNVQQEMAAFIDKLK